MTKTKKRIFYFDEIRALAILFVILIHVSKWFAAAETPQSLYWCFSSFLAALGNIGVPLFLMISGALLLNREFEFKDFFKRRFSRIFIPFVFWILIIMIFKFTVMRYDFSLEEIFIITFKDGFVWFVWMLVGIYLFYPVINSYIQDFEMKGCEYFLTIWLFTMILYTLNIYPIPNLELSYFAGYLGYFVLGYYLSNKKFKLKDEAMMKIGVLIFLLALIGYIYCIYLQIDLHNYYYTIFPMFEAIGLYLFFRYRASFSENTNKKTFSSRLYFFIRDSKIGKAIFSISICSYGMFLTHYFPIWILRRINWTIPIFIRNPFKWIPFMFIVCVVFSWGIIYLFSKIPYLKEVSGI